MARQLYTLFNLKKKMKLYFTKSSIKISVKAKITFDFKSVKTYYVSQHIIRVETTHNDRSLKMAKATGKIKLCSEKQMFIN